MPVREHLSDHDEPGALPLVTRSATVTRFEALDRNRNDEVERAIVELLDDRGETRWHRHAADGDARIDWRGLRRALAEGEVPRRRAGDIRVLHERYRRPYPSLAAVALDVPRELQFRPGQYVVLRYRGTPRPYSVASAPGDEQTELCIRRVPDGGLTADLFEQLRPGEAVTVRGPWGEFVLQEPSGRDLAFLATGTGVAPLKSMIEHTFATGRDVHRGTERDVWLFLGASWQDDLPYRERFEELATAHENFHFVPTCTREALLSKWDGESDYVQQVLVKYLAAGADLEELPPELRQFVGTPPATDVDERLDPGNLEVYACGINAMVYRLEAAVRALGVPDQNVRAEGYG